MSAFPETKTERYNRLLPFFLLGYSTCPTSNGKDLELWEEFLNGHRGLRV